MRGAATAIATELAAGAAQGATKECFEAEAEEEQEVAPAGGYDIVVPVADKDAASLAGCVASVRAHAAGRARRVLAVGRPGGAAHAAVAACAAVDGFVDERAVLKAAGADLAGVREALAAKGGSASRAGWYVQQLVKLHADVGLGVELSSPFLVVDADVRLLRDVQFGGHTALLATTGEAPREAYAEHAARLTRGLVVPRDVSGVCHLMPFHPDVLEALREDVEARHGRTAPFWRLFLDAVHPEDADDGASEYELYFHYAKRWHPERVRERSLAWRDASSVAPDPRADAAEGYDYVAYHTQLLADGKRRPDARGAPDPAWAADQGTRPEADRAARLRALLDRAPPPP